jgi:hypothetical protein
MNDPAPMSKSRTLVYCFAAILMSLETVTPAHAALDPELKTPYRLDVVLDISRHRLLTEIFAERLEQSLRDGLQALLGDMAQVTVVRGGAELKRRQPQLVPLLAEIRDKGLEKALDGYRKVSDAKTHFVLIDFEDGQYKIQARQHDGMTGLASPQVRRDQTAHPQLVARKAAALVELDFGLVGTVTAVNGRTVELSIRAGGLGLPLKRWLETGEVFAIAAINRGGEGLVSAPLQWALLQAMGPPRDGVCTCRLYNRLKKDNLGDWAEIAAYRCLKLGTTRAPLRLRLLDFKTHAPHDSLQVHVSGTDFGEGGKRLATDRDGMVPPTGETYAHVAFVRVLSGGSTRANIPVALVSPRTVDCLVSVSTQDEEQGQLSVRRERWLRRIYDSLRAAADRVTDLNELGKQGKRQDVLSRAREGLDSMANDLKSLTAEGERLKKDGARSLGEGEQRLKELTKRHKELEGYTARLAKLLKEETDPARQKMLVKVEDARLLEEQAEFDEALKLYDEILESKLLPKANETEVRARYQKLRKAWTVASQKHGAARNFIYKIWPQPADPGVLKTRVIEATAHFNACKEVGDTLAPQKLLRAIDGHAGSLKKRLDTLKPQASEDDRKEAETIAAVARDLAKLHESVTAYLKAEGVLK